MKSLEFATKDFFRLWSPFFFIAYGAFFYWFGSGVSLNEMFASYWLPLLVFFVFIVFFSFYKIFTMKKPMNRYMFFKGNERMQLAMDIVTLSFVWICFFAIMGAVFFSPFFLFGFSFVLAPISVLFLVLIISQLFLNVWREKDSGELFKQKLIRTQVQASLAIPFFAVFLLMPLIFTSSKQLFWLELVPHVYFATVAALFVSIGLTGLPMEKNVAKPELREKLISLSVIALLLLIFGFIISQGLLDLLIASIVFSIFACPFYFKLIADVKGEKYSKIEFSQRRMRPILFFLIFLIVVKVLVLLI